MGEIGNVLKLKLECYFNGLMGLASFSVEQGPTLMVDSKRLNIIFTPEREIDPYCFSGWRVVVSQEKMVLHRGRGKSLVTFCNVEKFFWGVEKLVINPYYIKGISNGRKIFQINL